MVSEGVLLSSTMTEGLIGGIGAAAAQAVDEVNYQRGAQRISAATGGGSVDMHVQIEHLIDFYNALSQLHEELYTYAVQVKSQAEHARGLNAGGSVAGMRTAWNEMTAAAGAANADASMAANIQALDHAVVYYMGVLRHNATEYAKHEEAAVRGFDHASGTRPQHSSGHDNGHDKGHAEGHAGGTHADTSTRSGAKSHVATGVFGSPS